MTNIQFITHYNERYSYVDGALMALKGGCRWIQLRMKEASDEEIIEAATEYDCDLICMAAHGRGGSRAILLGSETSKVLTHTSIPVLVLR